ncbi:MAG TPA: hypothetical protein VMA86_06425 [Acetobacteraceae bacterium]|nr:hypothetical protein [Acetobacteraceae bacterium]
MSSHKFAVGQTVALLPGSRDGGIPRGRYKIQRLLPAERREFQYRVKHTIDGHERVVLEGQLTADGGIFS